MRPARLQASYSRRATFSVSYEARRCSQRGQAVKFEMSSLDNGGLSSVSRPRPPFVREMISRSPFNLDGSPYCNMTRIGMSWSSKTRASVLSASTGVSGPQAIAFTGK